MATQSQAFFTDFLWIFCCLKTTTYRTLQVFPTVVMILEFGTALVGVLIVLALAAEVIIPVKEHLMDTLFRGLNNKTNAFSFHTHYITGFGSCCQELFIKFLGSVIL
jgi:hypothetical protein